MWFIFNHLQDECCKNTLLNGIEAPLMSSESSIYTKSAQDCRKSYWFSLLSQWLRLSVYTACQLTGNEGTTPNVIVILKCPQWAGAAGLKAARVNSIQLCVSWAQLLPTSPLPPRVFTAKRSMRSRAKWSGLGTWVQETGILTAWLNAHNTVYFKLQQKQYIIFFKISELSTLI